MGTSTSSLWIAVGAATLAEISAARWRAWPARARFAPVAERTSAVEDARALARSERTGHVAFIEAVENGTFAYRFDA